MCVPVVIVAVWYRHLAPSTYTMNRCEILQFGYVIIIVCCLCFAFRQNYFGDPWNVLDFVIVVGSIVDIIAAKLLVSDICTLTHALWRRMRCGDACAVETHAQC